MINENELRQGNYYLEYGTIHQFDTHDGDQYHTEQFEPIPLAPEILKGCGFEEHAIYDAQQDYRGDYFVKSGLKLYRSPGEECFYFRYGDTELYPVDKYEIEIKYLHQLQNLYFALKGEELEIERRKIKDSLAIVNE